MKTHQASTNTQIKSLTDMHALVENTPTDLASLSFKHEEQAATLQSVLKEVLSLRETVNK